MYVDYAANVTATRRSQHF